MADKVRSSAIWAPVVLLDAAMVLAPAVTGVSALWLGFWFLAGSCGACGLYLALSPCPAADGSGLVELLEAQRRGRIGAGSLPDAALR